MTEEGSALLEKFEGFRGMPYEDVAGFSTIGYGTRLPLSEEEAVTLMESRADAFTEKLATMCGDEWFQLTSHQRDALISFTYNVGSTAFAHSTVLTMIKTGALGDVPNELRKWVHAGGRVVKGLEDRREAEIALWNTPDGPGA